MEHTDITVTWGDSCLSHTFFITPVIYLLYSSDPEHVQMWYHVYVLIVITIAAETASVQTHKWAHGDCGNPFWVEWMQKHHIILPKRHHQMHHVPPYATYYCSLTGWANYPLEYINFWRHLEWLIENLTGWKSRRDDMKWSKKKQKFVKLSD